MQPPPLRNSFTLLHAETTPGAWHAGHGSHTNTYLPTMGHDGSGTQAYTWGTMEAGCANPSWPRAGCFVWGPAGPQEPETRLYFSQCGGQRAVQPEPGHNLVCVETSFRLDGSAGGGADECGCDSGCAPPESSGVVSGKCQYPVCAFQPQGKKQELKQQFTESITG